MSTTRATKTRQWCGIGAAACILPLATACQSHMMDTPVAYQEPGKVNPFGHVAAQDQTTTTEVFYATDRQPSGKSTPASFYSGARSPVVRLGKANVRFGDPHMSWEQLSELSRLGDRPQDPALEVSNIEEYGVLWATVPDPGLNFHANYVPEASLEPAERFTQRINARLAASESKNIYIFVHGFDTKFDRNLELVSELWHYLGRDGAFLSYAWPSEHDLLEYQADKANAAYSIRPFRLLLEFLASETDVRQINIFAHSAGSPVVVEALTQLRMLNREKDPDAMQAATKIGNVVLAAPDMELGKFVHCALDGFSEVAKQVNIYRSSSDRALGLSSELFHDTRLGTALAQWTPQELQALHDAVSVFVIDVDLAQRKHRDWLGHSYYQKNPWVSSDLLLALKFGLPPRERGLVRHPDGALWSFPEDYPQRVQEIAPRLYADE